MGTVRRLGKWAAVSGAVLLLAPACTPDTSSSDDDEADEAAVPSGTVAIPPQRLSPFCQAMIELSDRLETDPPDDVEALIVETYVEIEDDVPAEIAPDFAAVLASLQGLPVPTVDVDSVPESTSGSGPANSAAPAPTTAPVDGSTAASVTAGDGAEEPALAAAESLPVEGDDPSDEGYLPSESPTARLSAYVDYACGGSLNNPGPPATQPLDDIVPPTTDP